jgi:hypothetical protein
VLPGTPGRVGVPLATGMSDYSVQAWAELVLPELPIRVVKSRGDLPELSEPGEIVVGVVIGPPPRL